MHEPNAAYGLVGASPTDYPDGDQVSVSSPGAAGPKRDPSHVPRQDNVRAIGGQPGKPFVVMYDSNQVGSEVHLMKTLYPDLRPSEYPSFVPGEEAGQLRLEFPENCRDGVERGVPAGIARLRAMR